MITFTKKNFPTNAASLGIIKMDSPLLSNYASFHITFTGFNFFCHTTQRVLTKSQVYWRNPIEAKNMFNTLIVPAKYMLVEYSCLNKKNHAA